MQILRSKENIYSLKQGSYSWFMKLKNSLKARDFFQSNVDPCVFFGEGLVVLTYVDDVIIIGDTTKKIDKLSQVLRGGSENFDFTDKESIDK